MQTTGTALVTVKQCIPMRVRMSAQDGLSALGLLYLAAVRTWAGQPEQRQAFLDGTAWGVPRHAPSLYAELAPIINT